MNDERREKILEEVRDLPPAQREHFIASACAGDDELRSWVEAQLLHETHITDPQTIQQMPETGHAHLDVIRYLRGEGRENAGRYSTDGEVARGGMGKILQVHDAGLKRKLAMKVMYSDADANSSLLTNNKVPLNVARFLEEAQITAQLAHPGIVPVHDIGIDEDGSIFFTMHLVRGRELDKVFADARNQRGDWNLSRAVGVLVKACQAVAYAHSKGVIHRDLKPPNIMVGRFGEVYVMDWGWRKFSVRKTCTTFDSTKRCRRSRLLPTVTRMAPIVPKTRS